MLAEIDPLVTELAKQVPALLVLCFIVVKFLSHISQEATARNEALAKVAAALEKNTEALGHNDAALETAEVTDSRTREVLDEVTDKLRLCPLMRKDG